MADGRPSVRPLGPERMQRRLMGHSKIETTQIHLRRLNFEPIGSIAVEAPSGFVPLYEASRAWNEEA